MARRSEDKLTLVDRVMRMVDALSTGELQRLVPQMDPISPIAYSYPGAIAYLHVEPGAEAPILRALADRGVLDAEETTTVPVCPFCLTYPLRVERYCGACGSGSVRQTEMIHHFRCGNVGPEASYRVKSDTLTCPKCDRALRHIGVDYEKPSKVWRCDDCGDVMAYPELRYVSLTCGRNVPIDDVVDRTVYAYSLSPDGKLLATEGGIASALAEPAAVDALTGLPSVGSLTRTIELERGRRERYGTSFSVVRLAVGNGAELADKYGEAAVARVIRTVGTLARERLREVDMLARDSTYTFSVVLPETGQSGAEVVAEKLISAVTDYLSADERDETHREARFEASVAEVDADPDVDEAGLA